MDNRYKKCWTTVRAKTHIVDRTGPAALLSSNTSPLPGFPQLYRFVSDKNDIDILNTVLNSSATCPNGKSRPT